MSVPVRELQPTEATTTDCDWTAIGPRTTFVADGQKRDYLSRTSQRARGASARLKISGLLDVAYTAGTRSLSVSLQSESSRKRKVGPNLPSTRSNEPRL